MDVLDEDLLGFWQALNKHQVRYIMVGGFAVRFNGFNRHTDDLDLWLEDNHDNRKRLRLAFAELGYGDFPAIEKMEFLPGWTEFNIGFGIELDIMTSMKGLENQSFDDCFAKAVHADLEGVVVPFLHINDLIANKKAVARPKDRIDVEELEKIKVILDQRKNPKKD